MSFDKLLEQAEEKLLSWWEGVGAMLPNIALAIVVLFIFTVTSGWVEKGFRRLLRRSIKSIEILNLLLALIKVLYLVLGIFIALDLVGLKGTVASLLAGAGIIGLAIGFAFQDMAENLIAGIFLGIRKPFKVGHIIKCGDIFGTVKNINLRNTIVESFFGQWLIVPNKTLFRNTVTNYYMTAERQMEVEVGISYADDPRKAAKVIHEAINKLDFVINKDLTTIFADGFADSSVILKAWFWFKYPGEPGYLDVRHEAICTIKEVLEENDILIPFPIRTLDFNAKGGQTLSQTELLTRASRQEDIDSAHQTEKETRSQPSAQENGGE
ncbi:mechanosensitive ion channel family protein [Gayadomonas joobiniege]|uniref:mechanosensitive ion channel family protein n=1 Tax=Gayadomonas joobiniege TaxID=1234606 RepID=UPI0003818605|nr:mechanosensitive ion channel family protein [Gayadomonas joobiniege]